MTETATITWVADEARSFETQHGSFAAFKVKLEDERMGEVVTKSDTYLKRHAEYKEYVGKPTEFEITDQGTFPDGSPKPVKVKTPQKSGGGGGSNQAAHRNTKEGQAYEQEAMDRRTALMQAVSVATSGSASDNLMNFSLHELSDIFYEWLRKTKTSGTAGQESGGSYQPAVPVESSPAPISGTTGEGVDRRPSTQAAEVNSGATGGSAPADSAAPSPAGDPDIPCPACNTEGKDHGESDCPTCGGIGWVPASWAANDVAVPGIKPAQLKALQRLADKLGYDAAAMLHANFPAFSETQARVAINELGSQVASLKKEDA